MTMKRIFIAGLTIVILLFPLGCTDESVESEPVVRPVRYQKVESLAGNILRTFSGVSKAETETNLSFQVGGLFKPST